MVSIVMFASGHPDSACAALVSRFMNTSLTWPGVAAHPADDAVALGDGLVLERVAEQLQRVVARAVDVEVDRAGVHARHRREHIGVRARAMARGDRHG